MNLRRALHAMFLVFAAWWYTLAAGVLWYEWGRYASYERLHRAARERCVEAARNVAGRPLYADELGRLHTPPAAEAACADRAAFVSSGALPFVVETAALLLIPVLVFLAGRALLRILHAEAAASGTAG
jgi:hypothetical protein